MASRADHEGTTGDDDATPARPVIDRRLFLLGLAATAACGDGGGDAATETSATAAPTTTSTVPPTTTQPPTTLAPAPTTTTEAPLLDTDVDRALVDADLAAGPTHFVAAAATYVVTVPDELRETFKANLDASLHPGIDAGYLALFNRCTHLNCKVAPCEGALTVDSADTDTGETDTGETDTAETEPAETTETTDGGADADAIAEPELTGEFIDQFYCPCHASTFSILGEYRAGPAVSGLYHFPIEVGETAVTIRASTMVDGLARDVDLSGRPTGLAC